MRVLVTLALLACAPCVVGADVASFPIPRAEVQNDTVMIVDRGLTKTRYLPTEVLKSRRIAMLDGQVLSDGELISLAERKDSLAALKYTQRLWDRGVEAHASDIAYYGSIAAAAGRKSAFHKMLRAMYLLDPATEPSARKRQLISVLYPNAWNGNTQALDAVVDFNGEGKLFGALSNKTRLRILTAAKSGDGRVELRMAVNLLNTKTRTPDDEEQAIWLLERAQQSSTLSVAATAQNLIALVRDWQKERQIAIN